MKMSSLKLYISNELEILAEKLAEALSKPLAAPLQKEIILVQSKGMERWLRQELAARTGICANTRFPFPNTAIRELYLLEGNRGDLTL